MKNLLVFLGLTGMMFSWGCHDDRPLPLDAGIDPSVDGRAPDIAMVPDAPAPDASVDVPRSDATGAALTKYETPIILPECEPSNSEVLIIKTVDDWKSINSSGKRIFCVQPGNYIEVGRIELTAAGTPSSPRVIRWYDPADPADDSTHPAKMTSAQRATVAQMRIVEGGAFWIIDRIHIDGEYKRGSLLGMRYGNDNIANRLLVENANGDIAFPGKNDTIQNSVIRSTTVISGTDNTGIAITIPGNKIVNNEIYDCAGDQIIFMPKSFGGGSIIFNNDIYMETDMQHENGIDFKAGGTAESPLVFEQNRVWNIGSGDGGSGGSDGAIDFSAAGGEAILQYIMFRNNIVWDSPMTFATTSGSQYGTVVHNLSLVGNVFFRAGREAMNITTMKHNRYEIYYNTIVDVMPEGMWLKTIATDSDVLGNVIINGQGGTADGSGLQKDYNAYYNTPMLSNEGSNSISRGSAAESGNSDLCFTIQMHTNPKSFCIPYAKTTDLSPHKDLCANAGIGSRGEIGVDDNLYTQASAGSGWSPEAM